MKLKKISIILCRVTLPVIILSLFFSNFKIQAQTNNNIEIDCKNVVDYIDTEMCKLIDGKLTKGVTVSIVKDKNVVLCKGYGYSDEKNGIRVDTEKSTFKIGSVSEIFVSLAAMQLVEQGKLDMNKPITEYIGTDFPKIKYPVTMGHLLTHTAGFEDIYSPLEVETENEIIPLNQYVRNYMPNQIFKPGEVSAYSNYGIALAGYTIEKISGISFDNYADMKIFKPLKMYNTTYNSTPKGILSKAYGPDGTEKKDVLDNCYPAGSVTSTAQDMAKYMNFLLDENDDQSVIQNKGKHDMFSKHFAMDEEIPGYGYAWQRHEFNGHTFFVHGGGTANFTSAIAIYPEQNLGIFMSCNQISDFELAEYSFGVAEMLYGVDKEKDVFTGENSRDISGYYVPARSVFKGSDKFINLFMSSPRHITGNISDGFEIDGKKIEAVGVDAYKEKDLGYIKFVQKGDNLYFTPKQFYTSYIRVPWYESLEWQLFVVLLFALASLIGFIVSLILIVMSIRNKKGKYEVIKNISIIAVFIAFVSMILRFVYHVDYMDEVFGDINNTAGLGGVISFFKMGAYMIAVSGLCGIASTINFWLRKRHIFIRVFYSIWSIAVVLFILWLVQLNLI